MGARANMYVVKHYSIRQSNKDVRLKFGEKSSALLFFSFYFIPILVDPRCFFLLLNFQFEFLGREFC